MTGIVFIGDGLAEPETNPASVVGAKAHGAIVMDRLALPVPPAFVLGTAYCREVLAQGGLGETVREDLRAGVRRLEAATGRTFGGRRRPLLLSVRSGAPVSMPGMLDTILNVGLNESTVRALIRECGRPRQALDAYRRLIEMYGQTVRNVPKARFDEVLERHGGAADDDAWSRCSSAAMADLITDELALFGPRPGQRFPHAPEDQLFDAVGAVFRSWTSKKAAAYRALNGIPDTLGTAVMIQAMVFGNAGLHSGAGVAFTRDPSTGAPGLFVDFKVAAQGEDVVAGRSGASDARFVERFPRIHAELGEAADVLERHFRDMQDIEFTVESDRLYLLQVRTGKRTPAAALRIAVDMVDEGLLDTDDARTRLHGIDLGTLVLRRVDDGHGHRPVATGVPASAGVAVGRAAFDEAGVRRLTAANESVVLIRPDIVTDDIESLAQAAGILTATGNRTSHAAVVARQMGIACVVNCTALRFDAGTSAVRAGDHVVRAGDMLTLDGNEGAVYAGEVGVEEYRPEALLERVESWPSRAAR